MRIPAALVLAPVLFATDSALSQQCPQASATGPSIPSEARTLEGMLVYHDGIRQWFELKLDRPQCGQASIQLQEDGDDWTNLEILRGCRVRSKGALDLSPTGYYSLDVYQSAKEIEAVGVCTKQLPLPKAPKAEPDRRIRAYRVEMHVNYGPGDHPVIFRATSSGKELHPWQAYASYFLTGGFVLYGECGEGFAVNRVFGTPEAHPSHFTEARDSSDMAAFDPESAAAAGKTDLHLFYTCVRAR